MPILFNYSLSATCKPGLGGKKKQKQQAWRDVTITESSGRKWWKIWRTRTCCIFQKQRVFIRKVLIDENYKDDVLWHLSTFSATVLWFPANVDHYIVTFYRVAEGVILHIYTNTHDKSTLREGIIWYSFPQVMVRLKVFVLEIFDKVLPELNLVSKYFLLICTINIIYTYKQSEAASYIAMWRDCTENCCYRYHGFTTCERYYCRRSPLKNMEKVTTPITHHSLGVN